MHDVLRTRLLRKLESLPENQVYQILDYIEFLESKYSSPVSSETSSLQSFAEKIEDQLRRRTVSPASLREAFQLISAADKVLSNVANMGKELLGELNGPSEGRSAKPRSAPPPKEETAARRGEGGAGGGAGGSEGKREE